VTISAPVDLREVKRAKYSEESAAWDGGELRKSGFFYNYCKEKSHSVVVCFMPKESHRHQLPRLNIPGRFAFLQQI
jgi:hypothetical protein